MANNPSERATLWIETLTAEILVSEFKSIRAFAMRGLNMDYNTFRRYLVGERDMPFWLVLDSIATLGLTWDEFARRVEARKPARG